MEIVLKMENETIRELMAQRFRDARGNETLEQVYQATKVMASMISDLENPKKDRKVNYTAVRDLAIHYGVSVDWLLGLSNFKYIDPDYLPSQELTHLRSDVIDSMDAFLRDFIQSEDREDVLDLLFIMFYTFEFYYSVTEALKAKKIAKSFTLEDFKSIGDGYRIQDNGEIVLEKDMAFNFCLKNSQRGMSDLILNYLNDEIEERNRLYDEARFSVKSTSSCSGNEDGDE